MSKPPQGASVLHVITRLDRGGSADVVLDLAARLSDRGMRVGLAYGATADPVTDIDGFCRERNIAQFPAPSLVRNVSPLRDLSALMRLRRIIHRFRPGIVHTHTSKAGILGRFAARSAGVRAIVHTPHGHIFYGYFGPASTGMFIRLERLAARITGRITLLTEESLRDHLAAGIGTPELFRVIHSGVDIARYASGDRGALGRITGWGDAPVIGWAGRLTAVKDCRTFIEAAAIIRERRPECRFFIAGDGEERAELTAQVRQLGLDGALMFGGNRADIPDIMAGFAVFALTSRNEGFGRVLVEAMAAGGPVVATRVGGVPDVVEDGRSGILTPPGDADALADAVCRVLDDAALRESLIAHGRERAARFGIDRMIEQFEEVYGTLLADMPGRGAADPVRR